jgi:hypothetical protein
METLDRLWREHRWRLLMWGGVVLGLLAPLAAMAFTREVSWTPYDFTVAAALLGGGAAAFEFAARVLRKPLHRAIAGAAIAAAVLLLWASGAVGIF